MSAEPNQMISAGDSVEMDSSNEMPPMSLVTVLILVIGVLFFLSGIYLDRHAGSFSPTVYDPYTVAFLETNRPPDPAGALRAKGKKVFDPTCAPCHQSSGAGLPGQYPPLAGSEWVLAKNPGRAIRIVLNSLKGPVEVKGQVFDSPVMPQWRDVLKDEEIAAVLTFIRQNKEWGHNAPAVALEEVKKIRDETKDRGEQWTAPEVLKVPAE